MKTSNNETIAEIVREMRAYAKNSKVNGGEVDVWNWLADYAKRIEAAHKREIKGLIANLDALEKAVDRVCSRDEVAEIIAVKKEIQDDNQ